jgi:hypothetical protein
MAVTVAVREYLNKMLSEVSGIKALLLDEETVQKSHSLSLFSFHVKFYHFDALSS